MSDAAAVIEAPAAPAVDQSNIEKALSILEALERRVVALDERLAVNKQKRE